MKIMAILAAIIMSGMIFSRNVSGEDTAWHIVHYPKWSMYILRGTENDIVCSINISPGDEVHLVVFGWPGERNFFSYNRTLKDGAVISSLTTRDNDLKYETINNGTRNVFSEVCGPYLGLLPHDVRDKINF